MKARQAAYSTLLERGVIRVGLPIPANAEFDLIAVDDPYKFASAAQLSLFRRPLPSTNLRSLTTVMWDGRESFASGGPDLEAAVEFYDTRFNIGFTDEEKADLVAFLNSL